MDGEGDALDAAGRTEANRGCCDRGCVTSRRSSSLDHVVRNSEAGLLRRTSRHIAILERVG